MQPSTWMNRRLAAYSNLSIQEKRAIRDFALLWSFFEEIWLGNRGDVPRIRLEVEARLAHNASMVAFEGALRQHMRPGPRQRCGGSSRCRCRHAARLRFHAFAARRTPVLPLTSALWGSVFPSGQAGSLPRFLQTFIPTRFQFLGDWNYQS